MNEDLYAMIDAARLRRDTDAVRYLRDLLFKASDPDELQRREIKTDEQQDGRR